MVTKAHARMIEAVLAGVHQLKSGNYTIQAADQGDFFELTAAATISLPFSVGAGNGYTLAFMNNGTGIVLLDPNGAELINGLIGLNLHPGFGAIIINDGVGWRALITAERIRGSFTPTWTGFSAGPSGAIQYVRVGHHVALQFPATTGTSDQDFMTITNLPTEITPVTAVTDTQVVPLANLIDNSASVFGSVEIDNAGVLTFYSEGSASGFTTSANKGFNALSTIHYELTFDL